MPNQIKNTINKVAKCGCGSDMHGGLVWGVCVYIYIYVIVHDGNMLYHHLKKKQFSNVCWGGRWGADLLGDLGNQKLRWLHALLAWIRLIR